MQPAERELTPRERAIERVLKLVEVTEENGGTTNEAAVAERKALALIDRYAITYAEVEAAARVKIAPPPPQHPHWPPGTVVVDWAGTTNTGTGSFNNQPGFSVFVRFG